MQLSIKQDIVRYQNHLGSSHRQIEWQAEIFQGQIPRHEPHRLHGMTAEMFFYESGVERGYSKMNILTEKGKIIEQIAQYRVITSVSS